MTPEPRACLGGCGRTFARPKSIALCRAATIKANAAMRSLPLLDEPNAASRRSARFWIDPETVRLALVGDLDGAQQRIVYRAEHGLYASPDRGLVAIGA